MSGLVTRAAGWAAETTLSIASRSAGAATRIASRAALSVAELPAVQRATVAVTEVVTTGARSIAESPATAQLANTMAQAGGKFVQTATQVDHAAIETARGQVTLQLVDRLVAAETRVAVLERELAALRPMAPVSGAATNSAGHVAAGAAQASASASAVARPGEVAVQASASASSTGIVGRLINRLNPFH